MAGRKKLADPTLTWFLRPTHRMRSLMRQKRRPSRNLRLWTQFELLYVI
ncbi:unnamed protein product [Protopolystoma xenopodis]|uniref:Uncharacterized protein n=1 Tax=Protopolystoma xenopodis TaxID=117903 RepID=A0A448XA08_9PLAT|nr:unnamed protein product [Protopolystoma xenopodis]